MSSLERSWGSFVLSNASRESSQFLFPCHFDRSLSQSELKLRSLSFLERCLSLLSCSDSEGMCAQDRVAVYSTMLDNALSCKAFRELYQERDGKFRERFHSLPRSEMSPINVQLSTPCALQRNTVCYFTGIPASVMSDPAAWVVVPASLLREQEARRLQCSSS